MSVQFRYVTLYALTLKDTYPTMVCTEKLWAAH